MLATTATTRRSSSATFTSLSGFDPITSWDALRAPAAASQTGSQVAPVDDDATD